MPMQEPALHVDTAAPVVSVSPLIDPLDAAAVNQYTLNHKISARGCGLHSGKGVSLSLCPAPPDTGIVFRRVDLDPPVEIPALAAQVSSTTLSTSLGQDGVSIATVEHLLSAFAGLGVDNAYVEVDRPEVPIMDGSAGTFVFLLQSAGFCQQPVRKRFIRILQPLKVCDGDKSAAFFPHHGFKVSFSIDFDHPVLNSGVAHRDLEFSTTAFVREVCRARTFGFTHEFEKLRSNGLIRGGSLDNAIIVNESRVLNEGGLRCKDEFVMHKMLDAIGDLYLLGKALIGGFCAHKSGHALNNRLLRELLQTPDAWDVVSFERRADMPVVYNRERSLSH